MKKIIGAGLFTAFAASLCCIAPVLALLGGSSGIASAFSWIEPFRPYLISLTILVIGFAWHQKLKPIKTDECGCDTSAKPKFIQTKLFLGLATIFATLMITFPYYSKVFYPERKKEKIIANNTTIREAKLKIKGMTCIACEEHIKHEVNILPGIFSSEISYANGNGIVNFDASKTNLESIEKAINTTGYTVTGSKLK